MKFQLLHRLLLVTVPALARLERSHFSISKTSINGSVLIDVSAVTRILRHHTVVLLCWDIARSCIICHMSAMALALLIIIITDV